MLRTSLVLLSGLLLVSCGPSEKERKSGKALSETARKLDAAYQNWDSERMSEVSMLNASEFFSRHRDRFQTIRTTLAEESMVPSLKAERKLVDSVITSSEGILDVRKFVIRQNYELQDWEPMVKESPTKQEMLSSMVLAFKHDFDSLSTALERQVEDYNSSVARKSVLQDSITEYDRFVEVNRDLEIAIEDAKRVLDR